MFRKLWEKTKALYRAAKAERASPRELFWAVFVGVFAGCTPAVGVHGPLALGLATLFRKNRLWAWLGSRISNMIILPFIAIAEVQVAHRLRVGTWVAIDRDHALEQAKELLLDWCLGTIPVGIVLGALLGAIVYVWQRARLAKASNEPKETEVKEEGLGSEGDASRKANEHDRPAAADDATAGSEDARGRG